jgi:hypothetical protein
MSNNITNEKRQNLRQNITDLLVNDTLQPFEVDYLKKEYAVDDDFIYNEIAEITKYSSALPNFTGGKIPVAKIIAVGGVAAVAVIVVGLCLIYFVGSLILSLSGKAISGLSGSSKYERGAGSYVNRYTNRSYDNAKWEVIWNTTNAQERDSRERGSLSSISGWDKDNLTITNNNYCLSLRDHQWNINKDAHCVDKCRPYYMSKDSFILYAQTLRVYNQISYSESYAGFTADTSFLNLFQLEKDLVCLVGYDRHGNQRRYYEYNNQKFADISADNKKYWIWKINHVKTGSEVNELRLVHTFKEGSAIGGYKRWSSVTPLLIAKYENGLWYELHKTTHTGDVYRLWAR